MDRVQFFAPRPTGRTRAQRGERILELARQARVARTHRRLHLLEGEVGVEGERPGPKRHGRIDLTPHRLERRRGR